MSAGHGHFHRGDAEARRTAGKVLPQMSADDADLKKNRKRNPVKISVIREISGMKLAVGLIEPECSPRMSFLDPPDCTQ